MTRPEIIEKLAGAIRRAFAEHGRPNSFGSGELHRLYGGPHHFPAVIVGKFHLEKLKAALGPEWGDLRYDGGRFYAGPRQS